MCELIQQTSTYIVKIRERREKYTLDNCNPGRMQLAEATSLSCFINDVEETEEAQTFATGDRGGARKLVLHKIWGPRSENC